jgi:hypothetical protein
VAASEVISETARRDALRRVRESQDATDPAGLTSAERSTDRDAGAERYKWGRRWRDRRAVPSLAEVDEQSSHDVTVIG